MEHPNGKYIHSIAVFPPSPSLGFLMKNAESVSDSWRMNRRTMLRTVGLATGATLVGGSTVAARGPPGRVRGGPCHKDFACEADDATYAKFEFVIERDEDGNVLDCHFDEETDTGLLDIVDWESEPGTTCDPVSVEWDSDTHVASTVLAFGGTDCDAVADPGTTYESALQTPSGNTAAISNLQFCLVEAPFPACPFYGTSRADPTAIFSISYDAGADAIVETQVGTIPDDFADSNYPNGLAFDDANDVWYFAEKDGVLKTMNEDGALGIETYGVVTPGGQPVAGASFHDGWYYYIPNGSDELWSADVSGGSAVTAKVADLDWSNVNLGDLAIDDDGMLYVSTTNSSAGSILFSVDLSDTSSQTLIASGDADDYAVGKQLAFENDTLWAHAANGGHWYTVDVTDGSLSDVVATTREYTDLAACGEAVFEA